MESINADYLVVGAGGSAMAFVDTMLTESDATIAMVDRYHQPGGHWVTAYPFVRLHQPSAFYGVNSRPLGSNAIDRVGWNEGLYELATAAEVCAYFDQVMQQQFLPTGRVQYFPMSEYEGHGRFRTVSGQRYEIQPKARTVDATYLRAIVPSMRPAPYAVAAGVDCVPPNDLPKMCADRERYVIVGAGKTGIDSCLWLLGQGISPDRLTWVMPRDSWLLDRALTQPGNRFAEQSIAAITSQFNAIESATSAAELFAGLEAAGLILRIDPSVEPKMFRCATVSQLELEQLRRITDIVRAGRVTALEPTRIVLTGKTIQSTPSTLYIDCTADGLERRPEKPIFDGDHITLQTVRGCQQVFSAAVIAHVEAGYDDDAVRNDICKPVPHPNTALDWIRMSISYNQNHLRWLEDDDLVKWLEAARLDHYGHVLSQVRDQAGPNIDFNEQVKALLQSSTEHLKRLLAQASS